MEVNKSDWTLKSILKAKHGVTEKYIPNLDDLKKIVEAAKQGGYKVGLTQGVYDMFHVGHGRYLEEASTHADILIVGVDSDELTRSMKGPTRPFDTFEERIEILAMLSCVHVIVKRDVDQHMYDLIKLVKPDVLVMSQTTRTFGDEDKRVLNEYCGTIRHLEAKAATSTTAKLRRLKIEGITPFSIAVKQKVTEFAEDVISLVESSLKGETDGQ
ncbi:MAG: Glycerol-3-phosphate cytidylyltransferase [Parcubacteria bacterium C7867-006]|nr:MAG: Glycerol-3-phosphate cytidylyltransferase [Parcubacteria bacterium C7867-006]